MARSFPLARDQSDPAPRTWLAYARDAAPQEPGDDEQVEQWLRQARAEQTAPLSNALDVQRRDQPQPACGLRTLIGSVRLE